MPKLKIEAKLKGGLAPHKLDAVMAYVDTCLGEDLGYPQLARIAGLSEHHFGSVFRGATGVTPHSYLTTRRIEEARIRLADPTKHERLTDLSLDLGFSSPSHFSSVFLRQVGMTPRSFLKASRKKTC
jgi:AraC family transcriptional regulator